MRISNGTNGGSISGRAPVRGNSDAKAPATKEGSSSSSPASERVNAELMSRLREVPDVRAEVLADVERRLNSGQLLTREAAERTAEAIVAEITGK